MPRLVLLALVLLSAPVHAQLTAPASVAPSGGPSLPDGFYLEDAVDASFFLPVTVAFLPDGRMLVVQKSGLVRVVQDGEVLPEPFLDLRDEVLNHHDRGLLGIAVDPAYETTRRLFVSYTVDYESTDDDDRQDAFARVSSFRESATMPNVVDPASRRVLIGETFRTGIPSCYFSHTIGSLAVGADGTLLIGAGDGAHYGFMDDGGAYPQCFGPGRLDPSEDIGSFRSQRIESLAGKILRVDAETGRGLPSNPFYTGDPDETASKVWALGLRNPYRFSIAQDGDAAPEAGRPGTLYVGDVGYGTWEELNVVRGGENFGWPCREGPELQPSYQTGSPATNGCGETPVGTLTDGAFYWHHRESGRSLPAGRTAKSITGGSVYAGDRYPESYTGRLFYGDFSRGWTASARLDADGLPTGDESFSPNTGPVVSYVYDPFSRYLYLVDVVTGRIQRLRHTGESANSAPVARATASPESGGAGLQVQLSSAGSFDPDGDALAYQWDLGDGRTSTGPSPLVTYDAPGTYDARLALRDGLDVTRATVQIRVREGGAPSIRISEATQRARPRVGESVHLGAEVEDPDQDAGGLAVRWTVTQVHDIHTHPAVFEGDGPTATFVPAEHGANGDLVYYRVRADVRDDTGLEAVDEVAIFLGPGPAEADVSGDATVIAQAPVGGLETLTDGRFPDPGSTGTGSQVRTPGGDSEADWIGLEFDGVQRFTRLLFVEGRHEADGGWFERLGVQVRQSGEWRDVVDLRESPAYRAHDRRDFDAYALSFAPLEGDAIRLIGPPGGTGEFITATELRAWAIVDPFGSLPDGWAVREVGDVEARAGWSRDVFTVEGEGRIEDGSDRMTVVAHDLPIGAFLTAHISGLYGGAGAGLVLRDGTLPDAPMVAVLATANDAGSNAVHIRSRSQQGAALELSTIIRSARWLRLTRGVGAVLIELSSDGERWTALPAVPLAMEDALAGLVTLDESGGGDAWAEFEDVIVEPLAEGDLLTARLGESVGTVERDAEAVVLTGEGALWGTADRAPLAYRPMEGEGSVIARIQSLDASSDRARAGVVLRASEAEGAPYVGLFASPRGLHLQFRARADATTAAPIFAPEWNAPVWLRLDREGDTVAAFASDAGDVWTPIGTVRVEALDGVLAAGLVAASGQSGETVTARFAPASVASRAEAPPTGTPPATPLGFGIDRVYPNPARGSLTLRALTPEAGSVTVEVLDALGRRVAFQETEAEQGTTDVSINLDDAPPGVYLIRVSDGATGETAVTQVTVMR